MTTKEILPLIQNILVWAKKNKFSITMPDNPTKESIDFININLKNKTIYVGDMGIDKELDNDNEYDRLYKPK